MENTESEKPWKDRQPFKDLLAPGFNPVTAGDMWAEGFDSQRKEGELRLKLNQIFDRLAFELEKEGIARVSLDPELSEHLLSRAIMGASRSFKEDNLSLIIQDAKVKVDRSQADSVFRAVFERRDTGDKRTIRVAASFKPERVKEKLTGNLVNTFLDSEEEIEALKTGKLLKVAFGGDRINGPLRRFVREQLTRKRTLSIERVGVSVSKKGNLLLSVEGDEGETNYQENLKTKEANVENAVLELREASASYRDEIKRDRLVKKRERQLGIALNDWEKVMLHHDRLLTWRVEERIDRLKQGHKLEGLDRWQGLEGELDLLRSELEKTKDQRVKFNLLKRIKEKINQKEEAPPQKSSVTLTEPEAQKEEKKKAGEPGARLMEKPKPELKPKPKSKPKPKQETKPRPKPRETSPQPAPKVSESTPKRVEGFSHQSTKKRMVDEISRKINEIKGLESDYKEDLELSDNPGRLDREFGNEMEGAVELLLESVLALEKYAAEGLGVKFDLEGEDNELIDVLGKIKRTTDIKEKYRLVKEYYQLISRKL